MFQNSSPAGSDKTKDLNESFALHELQSEIRQAKKNSAPGDDIISYEMLRHLTVTSQKVILAMYNQIWESGTLPADWKNADVIPILKPGRQPNEASSYRPISLTSTLCKIMDKLVTKSANIFCRKE